MASKATKSREDYHESLILKLLRNAPAIQTTKEDLKHGGFWNLDPQIKSKGCNNANVIEKTSFGPKSNLRDMPKDCSTSPLSSLEKTWSDLAPN